MPTKDQTSFAALGIAPAVLRAIDEAGYAEPTPIQAQCIPLLIDGRDVLGQAQTGTGKTAAFGIPALSRIDFEKKRSGPAALVLAPTRELALQVCQALEQYGKHVPGVKALAIYGGADYGPQLRKLKAGANFVVGTPGRVMDHIRRGTLDLSSIELLVLDEADEMLKMGFVEDVEWIFEHAPKERQVALFSATMPRPIKKIADRHLRDAAHVVSERSGTAAQTIEQFVLVCPQRAKVEMLSQLLMVEQTDGVLVFVRTRVATNEVAKSLEASGHRVAALSGELAQPQREELVRRLRGGRLDVIVATDVAARGLDVSRVSHVINYDAPPDAESYVHRIGRTGRAGRSGRTILFATPRAKSRVLQLERATQQKIESYEFPNREKFAELQHQRAGVELAELLEKTEASDYEAWLRSHCEAEGLDPVRVAAASLMAARGGRPLVPTYCQPQAGPERGDKRDFAKRDFPKGGKGPKGQTGRPSGPPEAGMCRYEVAVGKVHGVQPKHLVGAIANEAGLQGKDIGRINIGAQSSTVDLPEGMPKDVFKKLQSTWVLEQPLKMRKAGTGKPSGDKREFKGKPKKGKGKPKFGKGKPKFAKGKDKGKTNDKGKAKDKPKKPRKPKKA